MIITDTRTKIISKVLQSIILMSSIVLSISAIIWIYFIILGFIHIGHLPRYGDTEIISFDGLDRKLIVYSLSPMFYGFCCWAAALLINKIFKITKIDNWLFISSLIIVILNILIVISPSFVWALD